MAPCTGFSIARFFPAITRKLYKHQHRQFYQRCHIASMHMSENLDSTLEKIKNSNNIFLMGCPGAGKSSVVKPLAQRLGMEMADIDDDVLEPYWNMPVSKKLTEVGDETFLELEAQVFLEYKPVTTVVALTGSQPMNNDAMAHAKRLGVIIYLDVYENDILNRLSAMKVNRIVGFNEDANMEDILHYRRQFYEKHYDIRVICEPNDTVSSIAEKVYKAYTNFQAKSGYISTRDKSFSKIYNFLNIAIQGLAPDGGLFVAKYAHPYMNHSQWQRLVDLPYNECALRILEQWVSTDDLHQTKLRSFVDETYAGDEFASKDVSPVIELERNQYLLELFHGPTGSFKDMALQLTAKIFNYASKMERNALKSLVLVATSGDTGGAVMNAFSRHSDNADVIVLFPEDGISSIQKAQLTSFDHPNCKALGIKGDFDFCQSAIKSIFENKELESLYADKFGYRLSSANSINFARLLPQIVYHAFSYLLMVKHRHIPMGQLIDVCVPTGNFGNILGAYYAKKMGIPIRNLVVACNENNIVHDFFSCGEYNISNRVLHKTASPAIDILKSSNLERYIFEAGKKRISTANLFDELEKHKKFEIDCKSELFRTIQQDFLTGWCSSDESLHTIKDVFRRTGYLMDPHTGVAKNVADQLSLGSEVPVVIAATAHFSKFSEAILDTFDIQKSSATSKPHDLMAKALTLSDFPKKHHRLAQDVALPRIHTEVLEAKQSHIIAEIEKFISRKDSPIK